MKRVLLFTLLLLMGAVSAKAFTPASGPSLEVSMDSINFGEVPMNTSVTKYVKVTGYSLTSPIQVSISTQFPDAFTYVKATGWDDYTGGILLVTYTTPVTVSTPPFYFRGDLAVYSSSDTMISQEITLIGAAANAFEFDMYVTGGNEDHCFGSESPVDFFGTVRDQEGNGIANVEVEFSIFFEGEKYSSIIAETDDYGEVSAVYEHSKDVAGHFTVNMGRVGNTQTVAHDSFDILGLMVVSPSLITCNVGEEQWVSDSILIRNRNNYTIDLISIDNSTVPDMLIIEADEISLEPFEEAYLSYSILGYEVTQGGQYIPLDITVAGDWGAKTSFKLWYYCREYEPLLKVNPSRIKTAVTPGKSKVVDVMLVNNDYDETGAVSIYIEDAYEPLGVSLVGDGTLPSLMPNDTAYFSIRIAPEVDVDPEVYAFDYVVESENLESVFGYVDVEVVTDTVGSFVIDVVDDFTFTTVKASDDPHVANAEVTVTGYHSLDLLGQGYTDDQGLFHVDDLPEGYYWLHVSADDHHSEYNGIFHVFEGENTCQVFLDYLPVAYSWNVGLSDTGEYLYSLAVDYETSGPVPVITIDHSGVHELNYGESGTFEITVTNHGTEDAYQVQLNFSESSEYTFIPLTNMIDVLPASSTALIVGTYFRSDTPVASTEADCDVYISTISMYQTMANSSGWAIIQNRSLPFALGDYSGCQPQPSTLFGSVPDVNASVDDPFSSDVESNAEGTIVTGTQFVLPCMQSLSDALDGCVPTSIPAVALMTSLTDATNSIALNGPYDTEQLLLNQLIAFTGNMLFYGTDGLWEADRCFWDIYSDLQGCATRDNTGNLQNTINGLANSAFFYYNDLTFVKSIFVDEIWNDEANVVEFIKSFQALIDPSNGLVSDTDAATLASTFIGTIVTSDDILAFVEKWNRSVGYWSNGYFVESDLPAGYVPDFIEIDDALISEMVEIKNYYTSIGYTGMNTVFQQSVDEGKTILGSGVQTTASGVKKSFSRQSAMMGEKLVETFTVHDGHGSVPMEDISLNLFVKDEAGVDRTEWFDITTLSMKEITGIDGNGVVQADKDGTVKIQYIPTMQAARSVSKNYYFGGTFSFTDPYTLTTVVHDLYPVLITVEPSPDLHVDFFMPRNIIADDTLTNDRYEPSVVAELGVIINNKGVESAKNVTLETATPLVVDGNNQEIGFSLDGVLLNGTPRALGMMEIPFGNIENAKTGVGEWQFTSKQLGRFDSYDAHIIHNSSTGISDLSLVSHKQLHELVHPIFAYGSLDDGVNDFMVNDVPDANDAPDSIYFSNGGKTAVVVAQSIGCDHEVEPLNTTVTLTLHSTNAGWNYGVTSDPGADKYTLISCVRDFDNQTIPLNNVWQTYVTLREGAAPLYENNLHIVDTLPNANQDYTYTLVYDLKSDLLDIVEITGIPDTDLDHPLGSFNVTFNKPVIDSTFTIEDMTLTCAGGPNLMDSSVTITKVNDTIFTVNIATLTSESGLYLLNVNSLHVKDTCGYEGYKEKQATWVQALPEITQTNNMAEGWNWWSPYVNMATEQDFNNLKTALGSNASMIKSRNDGFVVYYDNQWYGTLTLLNNSEMYMIDFTVPADLSIVGTLANLPAKTITLNPGWNWIGYPANGNQAINLALANLPALNNDILKTRTALATYSTSDGWVGTLSTLTPGEGYLYKYSGSEPISFVYESPTKDGIQPKEVAASNHWDVSVGGYDLNASIIGVIEIEGEEQRDAALSVGAFIDDRCVGQTNALYVEGLDRYLVFLTYFGTPNDEITFQLYDEDNNIEYGLAETTVVFETNSNIGTLEEPMFVRFNTLDVPEYAKCLKLFPNPVKAEEKVRVTLNEGFVDGMDVEVLSSLGVLMYKTTVSGDVLEMTAPLNSGVYIIKITSKDGVVYYGKMFVE